MISVRLSRMIEWRDHPNAGWLRRIIEASIASPATN
jgi:hypothetical protein